MKSYPVLYWNGHKSASKSDLIASEAKLSIEIIWGEKYNRSRIHLADVMRTPGHDEELAMGLLFSLGLITSLEDLHSFAPCPRALLNSQGDARVVIELAYHKAFKPQNLAQTHVRHAGCGLCGNTQETPPALPLSDISREPIIESALLESCEKQLRPAQKLFGHTGGTHAAALFDLQGRLKELYEDVGRHNALDKVVGSMFKQGVIPLAHYFLLMSSRGSYELVQKAHMAQIPLVAVVGAVSSLAVKYAHDFNITLVGFVRESRFTIYTHPHRINLA